MLQKYEGLFRYESNDVFITIDTNVRSMDSKNFYCNERPKTLLAELE